MKTLRVIIVSMWLFCESYATSDHCKYFFVLYEYAVWVGALREKSATGLGKIKLHATVVVR